MKILALEPYYGGSHRAFLDGWIHRSRHRWTVLGLPPHKWKWRMRHGAWTLAAQVRQLEEQGEHWDALFASSMLDLAQFRGLSPSTVAGLPAVLYFHENQLTYPVRVEQERDLHFGLTHFSSALAADGLWFNSTFHRDAFLAALDRLFRRMPDPRPQEELASIPGRCEIRHPGIDTPPPAPADRRPGPVRILWAARWEHDKAPETFFAALRSLRARGVDFRLSVLGESFRDQPSVFADAYESFTDRIDHWGYLPERADYLAALADADVFVSTARHEFFGLSAVEAVAAGAFPVLPRRLSYPEVIQPLTELISGDLFYDGGVRPLARRLAELAARTEAGKVWPAAGQLEGGRVLGRRAMAGYFWSTLAPAHDAALESLVLRTANEQRASTDASVPA